MQGDSALGRALAVVRDLRLRCDWDRAQTPRSLRPYLLEEAHELDQAIKGGDPLALRDELGDVLLHLAFQIVIAEENSQFNAEAVTHHLEMKMRRRHPHLYEGVAEPDRETWERNKRRERQQAAGTLSGLPATLPALVMAFRLQERAAGVGFDWPDAAGPMNKVKEETRELDQEMKRGKRDAGSVEDELGDLLFAVVNLARKLGVEPNQALERANGKFVQRFEAVERLAQDRGLELGRASLEELDRLWEEVKAKAR